MARAPGKRMKTTAVKVHKKNLKSKALKTAIPNSLVEIWHLEDGAELIWEADENGKHIATVRFTNKRKS